MKNFIFFLGLGFLFAHELDAMQNHEWRVLPLTSWLPDDVAASVFLLAHIPLMALIIYLVSSQNEKIRTRSWFCIAAFLVVHAVLHVAFFNHENYEFASAISNVLIFGGAVCGLIYILFDIRQLVAWMK